MLVEFTKKPVPEAEGDNQIVERLTEMRETGLPAFIVRSAGLTLQYVVEEYRQAFTRGGFLPSLDGALSFNIIPPKPIHKYIPKVIHPIRTNDGNHRYSDLEIHMDSNPVADEIITRTIELHHTNQGKVNASFFEFSDALDLKHEKNTLNTRLRNLHQAFTEGFVDDELLNPVNHFAELNRSDLVVFRQDGQTTLAHHFESTTKTRKSQLCMATLLENGDQ